MKHTSIVVLQEVQSEIKMEEEDYKKCTTHQLIPFAKMLKEVKSADSMFVMCVYSPYSAYKYSKRNSYNS